MEPSPENQEVNLGSQEPPQAIMELNPWNHGTKSREPGNQVNGISNQIQHTTGPNPGNMELNWAARDLHQTNMEPSSGKQEMNPGSQEPSPGNHETKSREAGIESMQPGTFTGQP